MADIKQIIKDTIKPNGEGLITGGTLQGTLLAMVSALDGGAFRGILTSEQCSPDDYDAAKVTEKFDKTKKWWYILFPGRYALPSKNPREWIENGNPIEEFAGIPKLQVYAHHIGIYYSDGQEIALITQRYEAGRRKIVFGRWLPKFPNIGDIYIVSNNGIHFRHNFGKPEILWVSGIRAAIRIVAPFKSEDSLFDCVSIEENFGVAPADTPAKRFNAQMWQTEYIGVLQNPYGELSPKRVTCARRVRTTKTVGKNPNAYLKSIEFTDAETGKKVNLHHTKIGLTCRPRPVRIPDRVPYFYLVKFRHYAKRPKNGEDILVPRCVSKFAYKFVAYKYNGRKDNTNVKIETQADMLIDGSIRTSGFNGHRQYGNVGIVDFAVLRNWGGGTLDATY